MGGEAIDPIGESKIDRFERRESDRGDSDLDLERERDAN